MDTETLPAAVANESDLPDLITKELDALEQRRADILAATQAARDAEVITPLLPEDCVYLTSISSGSLTLYVSLQNIQRDLAPALRALLKRGYKIVARRVDGDNQVYHIDLGPIYFFCRLPGGVGASCQFVVTGHKQVPVYELKCTDGSSVEVAS